jgi:hypothetical protein
MNNVASFEAMISVPGTYGEILKLNFIPIHGQDPERFKQLVALVRNPPRKRGRQAVYLVTREKLHGGGSSAIEFMHYIEDIEANPISLDQCIVMPWPNQSDREREKLIERWQKAYAKAHPGQPANAG